MNVEFVPLLHIQRDLQGLPRTLDRFRQYLRKLTPDGSNLDLPPLVMMNPMSKDHVTSLLAMDAEGIAARAVGEASIELADEPGEFKLGLVVADDLMGGWTNRYDYEFNLRFGGQSLATDRLPRWSKHRWLTPVLWSSEPVSVRAVREDLLTTIHRAVYLGRHGRAQTLREMLAQEGSVMAAAGCSGPTLDTDDIEFTREVLNPYLDATDKRTAIECLFGDEAGRSLGFTPRGLSRWAGLALALHDARARESAGAEQTDERGSDR